jgi:hypothetical protein
LPSGGRCSPLRFWNFTRCLLQFCHFCCLSAGRCSRCYRWWRNLLCLRPCADLRCALPLWFVIWNVAQLFCSRFVMPFSRWCHDVLLCSIATMLLELPSFYVASRCWTFCSGVYALLRMTFVTHTKLSICTAVATFVYGTLISWLWCRRTFWKRNEHWKWYRWWYSEGVIMSNSCRAVLVLCYLFIAWWCWCGGLMMMIHC